MPLARPEEEALLAQLAQHPLQLTAAAMEDVERGFDDPAMIKTAVDDMLVFLDGGEPEKDHVIPVSVVDAANVDQFQGFGDAVAAE